MTKDLKRNFFIRHAFLAAVCCTYFIAGGFLLYFTAYYTDLLDTVFYLHISEKYAAGNFYAAINNYWSPMISWLLIPFQLVHADPMISFKILQLLTGALALYLSGELAKKLNVEKKITRIFLICLLPVYLDYALLYMTPDLLFLAMILLLFIQLLDMVENKSVANESRDSLSWRQSIYIGITGAILYFTKSYGLPFFIVAISLVTAVFFFKSEKNRLGIVLKNYLVAITVFFFLAGCWMSCLYHKYGTFSTGYASTYNFNLLAPGNFEPEQPLRHPMFGNVLMPVEDGEVSAWESPSNVQLKSWNPIGSKANIIHYLRIISYNWVSFYYFMISRNTGILFILSLLAYFIFMRKPVRSISMPVKLLLALMIIYASGYSLVFFMPRYLWICNILMLLLMISLWTQLAIEKKYFRVWAAFILCLALLLEIKKPVKELLYRMDLPMKTNEMVSGFVHPFNTLHSTYALSMQLPSIVSNIKSLQLPNGNAAGIATNDPARFSYTQSLLVCLYAGMPFYGELPDIMDETEKRMQLQKHHIRYLYSWQKTGALPVDNRKLLQEPVAGFTLTGINP